MLSSCCAFSNSNCNHCGFDASLAHQREPSFPSTAFHVSFPGCVLDVVTVTSVASFGAAPSVTAGAAGFFSSGFAFTKVIEFLPVNGLPR